MNKLEDILWKLLIAAIAGLMIFSFTIKSCEKFEVYYYDLKYVYLKHPFMELDAGKNKCHKKVHEIVVKSIEKAQASVSKKKNAVVSAWIYDVDDEIDPKLNVTNEVYNEMVKG